jgi:hypothetical protein
MSSAVNPTNRDLPPGHLDPDSLSDVFQHLLRRDGENELLRLLFDMLEAGAIRPCEERSGDLGQYWTAARNTCFSNRFPAIEHEVEAGSPNSFSGAFWYFALAVNPLTLNGSRDAFPSIEARGEVFRWEFRRSRTLNPG